MIANQRLAFVLLTLSTTATLNAEIIDFGLVSGDFTSSFTQGSFTVGVAPSNTMAAADLDRDDVATFSSLPSNIAAFANSTSGTGVLRVTRSTGGSLFSFDGVDMGAFGSTPNTVSLTGFFGGFSVGTDSFTPTASGSAYDSFAASALSGLTLDALDIDFGSLSGAADIVAVDNLDLTLVASAAVPEPSSFACLLLGGIGLYARRRRRS
ncbi:MAG: hypothetical protein Fues2KO_34060 [Fuerstiella sp.]